MFYQKKNNKLEPLTGSTLYAETPIGTVIASFLAVAPSGYIKADGTVYTKAAYPELYERIPDVFKDTTNETFTIDLREVALKGIGLSSLTSNHYSSTGLTLGEFIEDQLQNHQHTLYIRNEDGTESSTPVAHSGGNTTSPIRNNTGNVINGRSGNTTEVKSVGVNYFIKAKHVALPIDIMDAISEEYATKEELVWSEPEDITSLVTITQWTGENSVKIARRGKDRQLLVHFYRNANQVPARSFLHGFTGLPTEDLPAIEIYGTAYCNPGGTSSYRDMQFYLSRSGILTLYNVEDTALPITTNSIWMTINYHVS